MKKSKACTKVNTLHKIPKHDLWENRESCVTRGEWQFYLFFFARFSFALNLTIRPIRSKGIGSSTGN
jgi:hypothetical protein